MSDIVDRLRGFVSPSRERPEICMEAADEIERLRAALEKIRDTAYSPQADDWIWMDDQTPIGQFIDMTLSVADQPLDKSTEKPDV